jgi:hypothetical protein
MKWSIRGFTRHEASTSLGSANIPAVARVLKGRRMVDGGDTPRTTPISNDSRRGATCGPGWEQSS